MKDFQDKMLRRQKWREKQRKQRERERRFFTKAIPPKDAGRDLPTWDGA